MFFRYPVGSTCVSLSLPPLLFPGLNCEEPLGIRHEIVLYVADIVFAPGALSDVQETRGRASAGPLAALAAPASQKSIKKYKNKSEANLQQKHV